VRRRRQTSACVAVCVVLVGAVLAGAQKPVDQDDPLTIPRIRVEDFRGRHARSSVLVVDVRDEMVFKVGHIPGAIGVPLREVAERVGEIRSKAKDRGIVTYCSCPSEQTAASAAVVLLKHGVTNVGVLVGGYPEWVATGGAIERGTSRDP